MTSLSLCDMHVHSAYSHDCRTSILEIKRMSEKHNVMVAITDHNRIEGSLAAKSMGIPVIPAIEVTTKKLKDILIYFYDFESLKEFYKETVEPALDPGKIWGSRTTLSENDVIEACKKYDCLVSLAHPFCLRPKRSAKISKKILEQIPAIEVMNFGMSKKSNKKASKLCDVKEKVHTAGSDAHVPEIIGAVTVGAYASTPQEFLREVSRGNSMVVGIPRKIRDVKDKIMQYLSIKME